MLLLFLRDALLDHQAAERRRPPPPPDQALPASSLSPLISLVLFLQLLASFPQPSSAASGRLNNATDLAALRAFQSLADPYGAVLNASWKGADFCNSWYGVACTGRRRDQRVTRLSLPGASLAGSIPLHIGNLSFLVFLNLSNNQLAGPLPAAALGRLRRLRHLDLSSNRLTGAIPAELGVQLPNLQHLDLSSNSLTEAIPSVIWSMASLRRLILSGNMLTGELPHAESLRLPNITDLVLSNNELSGRIPPGLGRLSTLQVLRLGGNMGLIGEIPPEIGGLAQLQHLTLGKTSITGTIPPEMGNLTNLRILAIAEAKLTGEIPRELGKLAKLQALSMGNNSLQGGFPAAVYNMSSLQYLGIMYNLLSGSLPSDLGRRLPQTLTDVYIDMNLFTGSIPSSLSNLSAVSALDLSANYFEGSVPPELGQLQQLTNLNLADNNLSGRLDPFLGALTNCRSLRELNLLNNQFDGSLPASAIANFTNTELYRFVGQGNRLTGSIPASFGNLTNMQTLVLSYNMLSGAIPPGLVALPNLQRLYLEVNRLEGSIPPEIGAATQMGLLFLQQNNLSGPIPDSIGNLSTALQQLNMAQNKLESELPRGLWRLTGLFDLNLAQNRLEGELVTSSDAMSNNITGMTKLASLDLSSNRFSGSIPSSLGSLAGLEKLDLSSNRFSGSIPSSLGSLAGLVKLDLSSNRFSGGIPSTIDKLGSLERLNLSFNNLAGRVPEDRVFGKASPGIAVSSFAGNPALCGPSWFGLPACKSTSSTGRHRRNRTTVIVVSVVAVSAFVALVLLVVWVLERRRRKNKTNRALSKEDMPAAGYPLISRHELAIATDGFSEANLIGAGSFGKVYRGRLPADGGAATMVAVKVVDLQAGEVAWRSFDAECAVMRTVRHRNLVGIITTCSNLDFRALVLPFFPNGSLDKWVHPDVDGNGPCRLLSLQQSVAVAADVAAALEYLHHGCSEPIVHCDLKPGNVLLDGEMIAHVGDFGIAKVLIEHSRSVTRTSAPGTFGYMAPEYGEAGRVTTKGDVYSYGILLLEIFTGKRPTDAMFAGDLSLRSWVAAAFPDAVEDVLDHCLLEEQPSTDGPIISDPAGSNSTVAGIGRSGGVGGESRETTQRRRRQCVAAVLELGLTCSSKSPKERPDMVVVAAKMKKICGSLVSH